MHTGLAVVALVPSACGADIIGEGLDNALCNLQCDVAAVVGLPIRNKTRAGTVLE
jgi:hypothetical protein